MRLLVYTPVKAPNVGWGAARTIGGVVRAVALLAAFVVNEPRSRNPLVPLLGPRTDVLPPVGSTSMWSLLVRVTAVQGTSLWRFAGA
jgi:hypothetical protein